MTELSAQGKLRVQHQSGNYMAFRIILSVKFGFIMDLVKGPQELNPPLSELYRILYRRQPDAQSTATHETVSQRVCFSLMVAKSWTFTVLADQGAWVLGVCLSRS